MTATMPDNCVREFNDCPGWPHPECEAEAERAYRDAFVAAAREASEWDFPDLEQIEAAWEARREVRRQATIEVPSSAYFNDPSFDDFEVIGMQAVYRVGHEVPASRARGRVQAFELAKQDWWELDDLGLNDDEEIRRLFMRPWLEAVATWAAEKPDEGWPPPRPLERFTPAQWRCVVSKQQGRERIFDNAEDAEAHVRPEQGLSRPSWDCRGVAGESLGRVFRWWHRLGDTVRLAVRSGDRWVVYGEAAEKTAMQQPQAIARRLITVQREQLEWLGPGRVPLGKLTLLCGDPGLGKSFLSLDLAARVSTGAAWPDMPILKQPVGGVVLFSAEDDLADTIAPRLDRAGADDSRIVAIEGVAIRGQHRHFSLETDLPTLKEVLVDNPDTRLVVIDPIAAYCGKIDSHNNTDVRGLLAPLADLAARQRVAILAITHLSKAGGSKAVYRAMGSLAFAAAARAVWAIVKDTTDPQRRLFLPAKLNLARDPDGLGYRITDGCVQWEAGLVKMHADDAFAAEAAAMESKPKGVERKEAVEWLRERLASGPSPSKGVLEEAKEMGFSQITLRRAYKEIGGKARKSKFDGGWVWELGGEDAHQDDQTPTSLFE
jgi:putative DNA primase/helicase